MNGFIGEYEATLDSKGRFLLPAGIKKQLPEGEEPVFVINRGFEKCLTMYPMQSWKPLYENLSTLNDFDPKVREFRRYFLNGAMQLELDSAGRILLPKSLMEHAGLEKDIVLVSAMNKMEIWDKQKYQQLFDNFSSDSFSGLAAEVMAKKDNNV
ncbi:MAG: division/cell wall cluster transcriptional repressor MraZ [Bacteroidota bacterium]|jgi:MraZ protein